MAKRDDVPDTEVPDMFGFESVTPDRFPFLRAEGNYDADFVSEATGVNCGEVSRTHQSFKDECDINVIVKRFGITGELPGNLRMPEFGDFESVPNDFHQAMLFVKASEQEFMRMPGEVRERFGNDPGQLLAFVSDPANRTEAEKLGLVVPVEPPAAPAVTAPPVVPPVPQ